MLDITTCNSSDRHEHELHILKLEVDKGVVALLLDAHADPYMPAMHSEAWRSVGSEGVNLKFAKTPLGNSDRDGTTVSPGVEIK